MHFSEDQLAFHWRGVSGCCWGGSDRLKRGERWGRSSVPWLGGGDGEDGQEGRDGERPGRTPDWVGCLRWDEAETAAPGTWEVGRGVWLRMGCVSGQ